MKRIVIVICCLGMTGVYAAQAEAPSMELLEFMGEWEGNDGQWQDPMQLVNMDDADLKPSSHKSQEQESQTRSGTKPVSAADDEVKYDEN